MLACRCTPTQMVSHLAACVHALSMLTLPACRGSPGALLKVVEGLKASSRSSSTSSISQAAATAAKAAAALLPSGGQRQPGGLACSVGLSMHRAQCVPAAGLCPASVAACSDLFAQWLPDDLEGRWG